MTGDRLAVIDLGSNTFHLLICEIGQDGSWIEIHKEREYVKLASGGIESIDENSEQRAIDAMIRFAELIKKHNVQKTRAIGTAALRESANGPELADKLSSITGIPVEVIDGQQEAHYIHLGIRSALPALDENGLIMDIGGGSVEFILFKDDQVTFVDSYKIGVAVLYTMFHQDDPIGDIKIQKLEEFIRKEIRPLNEFIRGIPRYYLIGASGSFEVIYDVLPIKEISAHWAEIDMTDIGEYLDTVIRTSLEERRQMPEIPVERIDYIVVAYLLIRLIIREIPPDKLYYCEYALKEGVIAEMIEKNFRLI